MTTLEEAAALTRPERGLIVHFDVAVQRLDPIVPRQCRRAAHPATGETVLGLATPGRIKLANLRARPQITATFRNGWRWAAVEGRARARRSRRPPAMARRRRDTATPSRDLHRCRR